MTFSEWITYVFDHPVSEPLQEWYWDSAWEDWDGPAETIVDYVTRTFNQSGTLLSPFSDGQVNQGLNYLINFSCSSYMVALQGEVVSLEDRLRCIDSMATLFKDCFATRCTPYLSHLDEPGVSPLNSVCYMWWDTLPLHGLAHHHPEWPSGPTVDQHILAVIEQGLNLSEACVESSLLGLGEWGHYYPEKIQQIIDDFIEANPGLRPELRNFALWMRARSEK
ncbi:hypothetical protein EON83_21090 [bacterium]|nr:MAG: hypothetical protein EON83_21090 [bacterium]